MLDPNLAPDSNLFNVIAKLAEKLKANPIKGYWSHTVDDTWTIGINGSPVKINSISRGCSPVPVPPYTAVIFYKGIYVGLCAPTWTMFVTGTVDVEQRPDSGLMGRKNTAKQKTKFDVKDLERIITEETRRL